MVANLLRPLSEDEEEEIYEVVEGGDEGAGGEEVVVEGEQGDGEDVVEGLQPSQTQGSDPTARCSITSYT